MNTDELVSRINQRIDNMTDKQCKEDMRTLIISLIKFTNEQDERILDPSTESEELGKLFFIMIVNLGGEAAVAQMRKKTRDQFKEKVNSLMAIWPMLQRYSNTFDGNDDISFTEVKQELPPGETFKLNSGE